METRFFNRLFIGTMVLILFSLIVASGAVYAQEKEYPARAIEVVVNHNKGQK